MSRSLVTIGRRTAEVEQVLVQLGVPPDQTRIIFLDNRPADLSSGLQGGEQLNVFPAVGGG